MNDILLKNVLLPTIIGTIVVGVIFIVATIYRERGYLSAAKEAFSACLYRFTRGIDLGTTDLFFDLDTSTTSPLSLKHVINWYVVAINNIQNKYGKVDRIAFIDKDSRSVGVITLLSAMVDKTSIPAIIIRLRKRLPQTELKGDLKNMGGVVLVYDVFTSGGGIKIAVDILKRRGINIKAVLFYISRSEKDVVEKLQNKIGAPLFYYSTFIDKTDPRLELLELKEKRLRASSI